MKSRIYHAVECMVLAISIYSVSRVLRMDSFLELMSSSGTSLTSEDDREDER